MHTNIQQLSVFTMLTVGVSIQYEKMVVFSLQRVSPMAVCG